MAELLRWFRCRFGWCGGRVVSGWRGRVLHIGWCCNECGKVKYYEPARDALSKGK
jgi:hypothetical protein